MSERNVLTAGWCPICPGIGYLVLVRAVRTRRSMLVCDSCQAAFSRPPQPEDGIDALLPQDDVTSGVEIASYSDADREGRAQWVQEIVPLEELGVEVKAFVVPRSTS
jgi:hypothetical protein